MPRFARVDRDFRRFVRTGDPRALGAVFDAAAPELLRIARYLIGGRESAEDVVQSAFLIAIERREDFDVDRAVLPWLCGIVANLARSERRRARRASAPTSPTVSTDPIGPAAAAELAEVRAEFVSARDSLGEPYRPVVELYLEHGLTAAEIARVLGRPSGTVRAQISRGVELLRKRLPPGLVAGAAIVALGPSALRAMRTVVVDRARAAVAGRALAGTTVSWIGGVLMNKKLVAAGVAVGVSLLALGLWGGLGSTPAPRDRSSTVGDGAVAVPARGVGAVAPGDGSSREQLAPKIVDPAVAAASERYGRVDVHVTWGHDGNPASGRSVEVVAADGTLAELPPPPRRRLTGDDGACSFDALLPGDYVVFASTGDRAAFTIEPDRIATVDLRLTTWGAVRGRVVDPHGVPVPHADIWISSEIRYHADARGAAPGHGQHGYVALRADDRGRFSTRLSRWQCVAALQEGFGPSSLVYPYVPNPPADGVEIELRLTAAGGSVVVDVRDAAGAPVVGAHVLVGDEVPHLVGADRATPPALRANTGTGGDVEIRRLPAGPRPVQVRHRGFAPWSGELQVVEGATTRFEVVMTRAATVRGVVTDSRGNPVHGAFVGHGDGASLASSTARSDAGGRFELDSLPAGQIELDAFDEGGGADRIVVELAPGEVREWSPRLSLRPAIVGVVLGPDDRPAADAFVVCAGSDGSSATGTSDAAGRFALGPLTADVTYAVTVEIVHPRQGALRTTRRDVAPDSELTLRIAGGPERTASLRGRLLHADGTAATGIAMTATLVGAGDGHGLPVRIDPNGAFVAGPFVAGTRLRLVGDRRGRPVVDLGVHDLRAHATVELGDVFVPTPGRAAVRLVGFAAANARGGVVNLYWRGLLVESRRANAAELEFDDLPPGDYHACLRLGGPQPAVGAASFTVSSHESVRVELASVRARRCTINWSSTKPTGRRGLLVVKLDDREVLREVVWRSAADEPPKVLLPVGDVWLHFSTPDGLVGETDVPASVVAAGGPIELELKRP